MMEAETVAVVVAIDNRAMPEVVKTSVKST